MPITPPLRPADWHGLARLATDGVDGTSRLVEQLHLTILGRAAPLGPIVQRPVRGITGLVYGSIRGINAAVSTAINGVAGGLIPRLPAERSSFVREQWLAAVNGVLGDHLAATDNPLAISMALRQRGERLELDRAALAARFDAPRPRLLIAVHGLCMNDLHWHARRGPPRGLPERLARAGGFSPLYLNYNSGRAIADNGEEFSELLEQLIEQWPVPVGDIVLLGHSMGGLLIRHALHAGRERGHAWVARVGRVAFLGTPHHGAPLERAGHQVDRLLGRSPYSAPFANLGKIRSAGIVDLRHGLDRDLGRLDDLDCLALAASARRDSGDGLVPVDSALGRHEDPERALPIAEARRRIITDTRHLGLLSSPEAYRQLRRWLR